VCVVCMCVVCVYGVCMCGVCVCPYCTVCAVTAAAADTVCLSVCHEHYNYGCSGENSKGLQRPICVL